MTLSCSRHQYAELAFDQSLATWLRLHRAAFEFLAGACPAGRARQSPRRDRPRRALRPRGATQLSGVRRALRVSHRALSAADARAKARSSRGRPLRQAQRPAGRAFRDLHDGVAICSAGVSRPPAAVSTARPSRSPGGLRPGRARALQPVPSRPGLAEWKQAKLHPDCHVVFAGAYYSAPHRLIGQRLWVRATAVKVEAVSGVRPRGDASARPPRPAAD